MAVLLEVGLTVATDAVPLEFVNFPATLAFSVNVVVLPAYKVPLVELKVIVGVALEMLHVNVLVPVVLSLHLYPLDNVAVTVCDPAFVLVLLLNV